MAAVMRQWTNALDPIPPARTEVMAVLGCCSCFLLKAYLILEYFLRSCSLRLADGTVIQDYVEVPHSVDGSRFSRPALIRFRLDGTEETRQLLKIAAQAHLVAIQMLSGHPRNLLQCE
ncbi:hypothetical protein MRX96_019142 [Rhipicephalus microplus]